MPDSPRAAAARLVAAVMRGQSLNDTLSTVLAKTAARDRGLLQQLCYGTLRLHPRLSGMLAQLLDRPLKKRDADIEALLLVGGYQLLYLRTPDHAAIDATVEACRELSKPWATRLVNAVLRRWQREASALQDALEPAARDAHPRWLHDRLKQTWPTQFEKIIAANNAQPPMTLRVNLSRNSRDAYLSALASAAIEAQPCAGAPSAIQLGQAVDVDRLPGFRDGLVSVQDEAAQWAAPLLDPQPGDLVLDACAAPGGKACHLLEQQGDIAGLIAMDSDGERLHRVQENLQRLALNADLLVADATQPPATLARGSFDRILVDAPCSGSGVVRRHPDIKLLRRAADIDGFARTQLKMLLALWPLLRPGGRLLYVTCSILPEENQRPVEEFLSATRDARPEAVALPGGIEISVGCQLLPDPASHDGLYYALLRKEDR